MRKIKRSSVVSGSEMCENVSATVLSSSAQTKSESGGKSLKRHLRERWRSSQEEVRDSDHGKLLSWPEDPEPARFRPPSRNRLVQPCRRKAPSPPHLRRKRQPALCWTFFLPLPMGGCMWWWLVGRIQHHQTSTCTWVHNQRAPHLESSWSRCWLPSSSERAQTSSPGWSCCCQWPQDPERQTDATQTSATDQTHSQGSLNPNLIHNFNDSVEKSFLTWLKITIIISSLNSCYF